MKALSHILFPLSVMALATAGVMDFGREPALTGPVAFFQPVNPPDTVIYPHDGYKLRRKGDFTQAALDSLFIMAEAEDSIADLDTIPHLTARDTIKVPDSLRLTDPFRYKYYVALMDSLTHVIVVDSLKAEYDSLKSIPDSLFTAADSLLAMLDSLDWTKVDSIYLADSTAAAKAAFEKFYWGMTPKERRKYDKLQMIPIKMAEMDSIRKAQEEQQAIRDSIVENTPRILETYAIPDSMMFKRLVTWTEDRDFGRIEDVHVPDTTFNYRFYDHRWQREDVNATWLGVAGSPVQKYNFFQRASREGVSFNDALEAWSYDPGNLPHFNTKTPYTELSYYGTIIGNTNKESDNLHLFTTQNITPAFNFQLLYDRYGGGGFLESEETRNNNGVVAANYLGRKYTMHAGFIHNNLSKDENGGVQNLADVRDTLLESRSIPINLKKASSKTAKNTVFLDQQLRIPFNFINELKARRDSTFKYNADSLDMDVTTAFVGHSSEISFYRRTYQDEIGTSEAAAHRFYNNVFNYNPTASADTQRVMKLDNRFYIRLQPWSSEAIVSKLDVGIGDRLMQYHDSTTLRPMKHVENSVYLYAGAEGQLRDFIFWNAKGRYYLIGYNFGDFSLEGNAGVKFYPFRRNKKSPLSLTAHFETSLQEPTYYQRCVSTNHYSWSNEFSKVSTTKIRGILDIPYWRMNADVGYALLANPVYYDSLGIARQHSGAMSVLSASLRKDFVAGPLHLENRALVQLSSNQKVVPVPTAAFNARWYFQFVLQKDVTKTINILEMQAGVNAWYNTAWHAPAWNPNLGVFYNQIENLYNNGPVFDFFINMQWKRAVIFVKYQNALKGWPMKSRDYFSADRYILNSSGDVAFSPTVLKLGLYWPFYIQPGKIKPSALKPPKAKN